MRIKPKDSRSREAAALRHIAQREDLNPPQKQS